ncbi:hypothetical protein RAJCM14343_2166 [Rhodococcus aetherivorans]|uniref:Uncharacterized protein n=1 Tax=Rhodococcus aetherivorans TaxID=191292 RepID=A0ABQ0YK57_9NOCA|nr:hypothetical protein RAJCM14343_2166 [Rhodococcus aetherivorans]
MGGAGISGDQCGPRRGCPARGPAAGWERKLGSRRRRRRGGAAATGTLTSS